MKHLLLTGDTHGRVVERLKVARALFPQYAPDDTGIIILGDSGFNFYLNKRDYKLKQAANDFGYTIYCVRGNHEERPEKIATMETRIDLAVGGEVYLEPEFSQIRYLKDGGIYRFSNLTTLILGGAYSVDKEYRLLTNPKLWFATEQLSKDERAKILSEVKGKSFDMILSHTVPYSLRPTDLFLPMIDQSKVDESTEFWLEKVKHSVDYNIWLAGHFHDDRKLGDNAFMLYENIIDITEIKEIIYEQQNYPSL